MVPVDLQNRMSRAAVNSPTARDTARNPARPAGAALQLSPRQLAEHQKLQRAAGEFESMLLANLWKSMKASFSPAEEESEDPAHGMLEDWGMDAMAGAVGRGGGIGLGRLILRELGKSLDRKEHLPAGSAKDFGSSADKM